MYPESERGISSFPAGRSATLLPVFCDPIAAPFSLTPLASKIARNVDMLLGWVGGGGGETSLVMMVVIMVMEFGVDGFS